MKLGVGSDIFVQNGLISMNANCGFVVDALDVFEGMRDRDLVSWSTLITCFTINGLFEEALGLGAFREMQMRTEIEPDMVTMVSIISAISSLGALELGKWVHCFVEKSGFGITASLGTALITMYSKCGFMEGSVKVFEKMSKRNLLTWTALIKGLAEHGQSRDAVAAFYKMKESGLQPDYITFIGVLSACSHGGLLEEGWDLFNSIKRDFGFEPGIEHYGCMVDLLGRKGLINEAFEFMEGMAIKPTSILWRTLLGACVTHGNIKMAVQVARKVQELDPYHDGDYVLLSNAYGVTGAWTEKAGVRNLMNVKGIRKEPGCSLIEVDQVIHEFVAGDDTHPRSLEIKEMLKYVLDRLKAAGYDPDISNVLFDIDEEEKEESLNFHSEKLAVAFALIMFKVDHRKTIRIVKNLRICRDCHSFMKLVSREFAREIIIRDRNRFHHFRDEACSCNDYW